MALTLLDWMLEVAFAEDRLQREQERELAHIERAKLARHMTGEDS